MFDTDSYAPALTVLGIIITILLPVIGWVLRQREYRQLDIVIDKAFFLVNELAGNVKNFSILVDGKPASDQILWMTGWIINSGNFDISERMIDNPLKLKLSSEMRWIRGSIERHSKDISCDCKITNDDSLEFGWTLLRSGEYIYFETLIEFPQDEIEEDWDIDSLLERIHPHSRIENIRTDSLVPLAEIGERYNPSRPRKLHIVPKVCATFLFSFLIFTIVMGAFFPFDLDKIYDDGYLLAHPGIAKIVDDKPRKIKFLMNKQKKIKINFSESRKNVEHSFDSGDELFAQDDIVFFSVSVTDRAGNIISLIVFSFLTVIFSWIIIYMWIPSIFLFNFKKRRTASALFSLQKNYNRDN